MNPYFKKYLVSTRKAKLSKAIEKMSIFHAILYELCFAPSGSVMLIFASAKIIQVVAGSSTDKTRPVKSIKT